MPSPITGNKMRLYYFIGGVSVGTPTLLPNVRDVNATFQYAEADIGVRGDPGTPGSEPNPDDDAVEPTTRMRELTFDLLYKSGDTDYAALHDAMLAKTIVGFKRLDPSGKYVQSDFKIFGMDDDEPRKDMKVVKVTCKQTSPANFSKNF